MKTTITKPAISCDGCDYLVGMRERARISATSLWISGSKEASAAKRASLDLTRELAEMRKP